MVRLQRTIFTNEGNVKETTAVKLDPVLQVGTASFALRAIIVHTGEDNAAHYTCCAPLSAPPAHHPQQRH